jgi:hypothetical protein
LGVKPVVDRPREVDMLPLIEAIQRHVAIVAISPSAVRRQGAGGVVACATEFLAVLPLRPFGVNIDTSFRKALDEATEGLKVCLPEPARTWGLARKCVNIFLRDAFYNLYLSNEYQLAKTAPYYEIPLDSVVSNALRKHAPPRSLPTWLGVKHLSPETSNIYQTFALELSYTWKIDRVFLDTYLWVENRDAPIE